MGAGSELPNEIYVEPEPFKPVHFWPGNQFTLAQEDETVSEPLVFEAVTLI